MSQNLEQLNKYYTPSIDEFYVGFQCEIRLPDWQNFKKYQPLDFDTQKTKELLENDNIRVKYLDKSDIESCGFVCEVTSENYLSFFKDDLWLQLTTISGITKLAIKDQETFLFIGTIKNINELHKLLKQIDIEDTLTKLN